MEAIALLVIVALLARAGGDAPQEQPKAPPKPPPDNTGRDAAIALETGLKVAPVAIAGLSGIGSLLGIGNAAAAAATPSTGVGAGAAAPAGAASAAASGAGVTAMIVANTVIFVAAVAAVLIGSFLLISGFASRTHWDNSRRGKGLKRTFDELMRKTEQALMTSAMQKLGLQIHFDLVPLDPNRQLDVYAARGYEEISVSRPISWSGHIAGLTAEQVQDAVISAMIACRYGASIQLEAHNLALWEFFTQTVGYDAATIAREATCFNPAAFGAWRDGFWAENSDFLGSTLLDPHERRRLASAPVRGPQFSTWGEIDVQASGTQFAKDNRFYGRVSGVAWAIQAAKLSLTVPHPENYNPWGPQRQPLAMFLNRAFGLGLEVDGSGAWLVDREARRAWFPGHPSGLQGTALQVTFARALGGVVLYNHFQPALNEGLWAANGLPP